MRFVLVSCSLFFYTSAHAAIWFDEVPAAESGLNYVGRSFGASWGDFNDDGLPDIWVSNHQLAPTLYLNNGAGGFLRVDFATAFGDSHGAAWADFDNDGDQDLLQTAGAFSGVEPTPNALLVNYGGGVVTDEAVPRGLASTNSHARSTTWWDWNNDGLLDLVLSNAAPSNEGVFYEQDAQHQFTEVAVGLEGVVGKISSTQIADLNGDGRMELIAAFDGFAVFDTSQAPFVDISSGLGVPPSLATVEGRDPMVLDVAIADFNGDLRQDLYLTRNVFPDPAGVRQVSPEQAWIRLVPVSDETAVNFRAPGVIQVHVRNDLGEWSSDTVYIGASGVHPSGDTFILSTSWSAAHGLTDYEPGAIRGLFIGYDTDADVWLLRASVDKKATDICGTPLGCFPEIRISALGGITDIEALDFTLPGSGAVPDYLFFQNDTGQLEDVSATHGVPNANGCSSVGAGDFDNDMDVDLYLVCRGALSNTQNILLENDGQGVFTQLANSGGAFGLEAMKGDTVSVADYDLDGFLDLFVTNGAWGSVLESGIQQLYRNAGNTNHWIAIDLEGVQSNRDGIGATVYVTAGGTTQVRVMNGGVHGAAQDFARLHFGLGSHTVVESIEVHWPSGLIQEIEQVAVDQIMLVQEAN